MFTGIVQTLGRVKRRELGRLHVRAALPRVRKGDSVAVEGVCLTAISSKGGVLAFDLSPETLRLTTLGGLRPGQSVNLEPPLRAGDPLGGHFVSGHVEGVGTLLSKTPQGDGGLYKFGFPPPLGRYLVPKGCVAVDGVSLTVVKVQRNAFTAAVIPHTQTRTTLGRKAPGDPVNLEPDMLAKYLERLAR